mmetsp:Transcript_48480/g.113142  ORF Transcript_48480/g.113142 Transcript_48480/m.113142 type:complete len:448 (-) Transcript_48480:374-1717(-)
MLDDHSGLNLSTPARATHSIIAAAGLLLLGSPGGFPIRVVGVAAVLEVVVGHDFVVVMGDNDSMPGKRTPAGAAYSVVTAAGLLLLRRPGRLPVQVMSVAVKLELPGSFSPHSAAPDVGMLATPVPLTRRPSSHLPLRTVKADFVDRPWQGDVLVHRRDSAVVVQEHVVMDVVHHLDLVDDGVRDAAYAAQPKVGAAEGLLGARPTHLPGLELLAAVKGASQMLLGATPDLLPVRPASAPVVKASLAVEKLGHGCGRGRRGEQLAPDLVRHTAPLRLLHRPMPSPAVLTLRRHGWRLGRRRAAYLLRLAAVVPPDLRPVFDPFSCLQGARRFVGLDAPELETVAAPGPFLNWPPLLPLSQPREAVELATLVLVVATPGRLRHAPDVLRARQSGIAVKRRGVVPVDSAGNVVMLAAPADLILTPAPHRMLLCHLAVEMSVDSVAGCVL